MITTDRYSTGLASLIDDISLTSQVQGIFKGLTQPDNLDPPFVLVYGQEDEVGIRTEIQTFEGRYTIVTDRLKNGQADLNKIGEIQASILTLANTIAWDNSNCKCLSQYYIGTVNLLNSEKPSIVLRFRSHCIDN